MRTSSIRPILILLAAAVLFLLAPRVQAQSPPNADSSQEGNIITFRLDRIKAIETVLGENFSTLEREAFVQKINTLKNPFLPQIPEKETPEGKPTAEEKNITPPTPARIDRRQPGYTTVTATSSGGEIEAPPPPRPNFKLSGIVWNSDRPQAIINNQVVDQGDHVNEWEITEITELGIQVQFQDTTYSFEPPKPGSGGI